MSRDKDWKPQCLMEIPSAFGFTHIPETCPGCCYQWGRSDGLKESGQDYVAMLEKGARARLLDGHQDWCWQGISEHRSKCQCGHDDLFEALHMKRKEKA